MIVPIVLPRRDGSTLPPVRWESIAGRIFLLGAGVLMAATVAAQQAAPAAQPAAKAAAPASAKSAKPAAKKGYVPGPRIEIEPKALAVLKAMSDKLVAAKTMSFTAEMGYESPSRLGPALVYTTRADVTMQRPDKLRVIVPGDGPPNEFYYDGKAMVAYLPAENFVAVSDAPATIDATLEAAYQKAFIYFPFTDLIVADPYKDITDGLRVAFYIGQSKAVGGTTTDMIAYANDDVFIQAWIGADDKLPRRVRAQFRSDKARLRHQMDLSNWQLDTAVAAEAFAPSGAAKAAKPVPFARPEPANMAPGAKPPVKSAPPASK